MLPRMGFSAIPFSWSGNGLQHEKQEEDQSGTEAQEEGPGTFARGDLPEPPPMQSEVEDNEREEIIPHPGMPVAPFVTIEAERAEAGPAA